MADWTKYVEENLDFAFDFTARLSDGETVTSYTVAVPDGLTKGADSETGGVVTVWLDGGGAGTFYLIECVIVTSAGREMVEKVTLYVR